MNFNTYRPQRGKIQHRGHAVENLAFETLDINLDDCGDAWPAATMESARYFRTGTVEAPARFAR